MKIIAVDPGTYQSGIVVIDSETLKVVETFKAENNLSIVIDTFKAYEEEKIIFGIEMIQPMNKKVGKETFETLFFIGRLYERLVATFPQSEIKLPYRKSIVSYIYGDVYGNDAKVREKLLQRFGKEHTKKIFRDCWQAFALAVFIADKEKTNKD